MSDSLADALRAFEAEETDRAAAPDTPIIVRVDGVSFSKFVKPLQRPFDPLLSAAMVTATKAVVDEFKCALGYTQSDEATFVLIPNAEGHHSGGRLQKLTSIFAAKFTAAFLIEAIRDFPHAIGKNPPAFDARVHSVPDLGIAAKNVLWRELDGRRNAVNMIGRAYFSHRALQGKSTQQVRAMLAEVSVDFEALPEAFRRGTFLKRISEQRYLTDAELACIPEAHRPTGPVTRSRVSEIAFPPLALVDNLEDVLFRDMEPILKERNGFAATVMP